MSPVLFSLVTRNFTVALETKMEDLWIGAFWRYSDPYVFFEQIRFKKLEVWICLLPCLPVHLTFGLDGAKP